MISILVASKAGRAPLGLHHAPAHELLVSSAPGWANAANALLDAAAAHGRDALFLDDDVTLYSHSLAVLAAALDAADLFGFTLLNGPHVASAGFVANGSAGLMPAQTPRDVLLPAYVAHVTASALYIKSHVLRAGLRFPVWPGMHHEDVAFTFDAWLRGFRVAYLPGAIDHPLTEHGAGATKSAETDFHDKRMVNAQHLGAWVLEHGVIGAIATGRIPTERRGL